MTPSLFLVPHKHHVLVVDDEQDIFTVTRLSLKGLRYRDRPLELLYAATGEEAVRMLRANPAIAVILLDVVMETDSAGLDACQAIREELGNRLVRILLRTGQPGAAPERQTIDHYDIDGYLEKAALTSNRLYSAVRAALKAWEELVELERHRRILTEVHECVVSLHAFNPLETTLERVLNAAVTVWPGPLAVLYLETFDGHGNPRQFLLHLATDPDPVCAWAAAVDVRNAVTRHPEAWTGGLRPFHDGTLVPLTLHRELGHGWLYLQGGQPDALAAKGLALLTGHAVNALYATVALRLLEAPEESLYDRLAI
ncbi:MAG: response regulator [Mycobacterium leprae]